MANDAVVLGGGGVAGIAWETGLLQGIQDAAPDLLRNLLATSTTLIGTSAGSAVAAQLALGIPLSDLFAAQTADATAEQFVQVDLEALVQTMGEAVADALTPADARRRLGAMALAAETPSTGTGTAIIQGRIPTPSWPAHPLMITAVDTESASRDSSIEPTASRWSTRSPPAAPSPESGRPSRSRVATTWTAGCAPSPTPISRQEQSGC